MLKVTEIQIALTNVNMASLSEGDGSARYVERLALSVGASEAALRILISILIGMI